MEFLRSFLRRHFGGEIIDGVAKCRLFSQASIYLRSVFRPLRLEVR